MNREFPARGMSWPFRTLALLGVICGYQIAHAQAPPNLSGIAGRTIKVTVTSASGLAFAGTEGSQCRLLPSASGAAYDIVPVPASSAITPSTGSIQSYSVNGSGNVATLSLYDTVFGVAATVTCTFSTDTSGSFSLNAGAAGSQSGTFTMSAANSPASIAGTMFVVTITSGGGAYGDTGQYRFRPNAANYNVESLSPGVISSAGNFFYEKNNAYTGRIIYTNDTVVGNGATSRLSFDTATSGTITLIHQNGWPSGFQTGTFTFSPNTIPTISAFTSLANATTNEDTQSGAIGFTVGDGQTLLPDLTVSATSSVPGLVSNFNFGGAGGNRTVMVMPALNKSGTATITVTVTDAGGLPASRNFTLTVNAVNDPPTITPIANQTAAAGVPTAAIPFTINDVDTPLTSLTLAKASTSTAVVPLNNIVLGGSGTERTVTITPAGGQTGSSTITLTVNGGGTPTSTSFTVMVNSPPTISNIPDADTNEDTATAAIPFTIGDTQTPLASLTLAHTSTNPILIGSIAFGGSNGSRNVTVIPAANQTGSSNITVTVTDGGGATASDSFLLTVNAVNDPPVISSIANQTTGVGVSTAAIPFTISDVDSPPASFTIANRSSSNTTLVPVAGIVVGGSGANRTVTVTPAAGQTGFADITLTVGDGQATASATFRVTVAAPFLIGKGAAWRYLAPLAAASAPSASWTGIGFSDTSWGSGSAPIGYGGDGEVTAIPTASGKPFTMYLRRKFTVTGAAGTLGLGLNLRRDDGAVVYLNGIEKWRSNMPEGVSISYSTPATTSIFGTNEALWVTNEVSASGLVEGDNVVSVEVHQFDTASSDISFDLEVIPLSYAPNTPPWIGDITDRVLAPAAGTGAVAFSVGDGETPANALSVTANSSNPAVIPAGNILFGGSSANRTVTVTAPSAGQPGSTLITVTVSDGVWKAATAFVVTVTPSTSSVKLAAWGDNDRGQLGNNSTTPSDSPLAVSFSGALAAKTPVQIAAGDAHCIVLFSDGTLASWGSNDCPPTTGCGQLGTGSSASSLVPVAVQPNGVLSGKQVVAIAAGRFHSIALCSDSTIACWGAGGYGQLGNNLTANSRFPVQVINDSGALAGKVVTHVAAGSYHNLALCSDGTIAAWGYNRDGGQLGNNSTVDSRVPVSVSRTGPLLNRTVIAIAAGGGQSLALCSDGTLAAWGDNDDGQLGNNGTADSSVPVEVNRTGVLATRTPTAIAAGNRHCLAACSDGRVAAWGYNGSGQLGDNTSSNRSTPVLVVNNTGALSGRMVYAVAAGLYGSAAVCTDGTAAEWGDTNDPVPVVINVSGILPGRTIFDVAAGSFYKVALTSPSPAPFRVTTMSRIAAGDVFLGFPTLEGVSYHIDWSDMLGDWNRWGTVNGIGGELITRLTGHGAPPKRYFRAAVAP